MMERVLLKKTEIVLLFLLCLLCLDGCSNLKMPMKKNVSHKKKLTLKFKPLTYTIWPGGILKLEVPYAQFRDKKLELFCGKKKILKEIKGRKFIAYLSESYFSKRKKIKCFFKLSKGKMIDVARVNVVKKNYPSESLRVDRKRVKLSPKDQQRVNRERKMLNGIYSNPIGRSLFTKKFLLPLKSLITSVYGVRRLFNNIKKSQHLGIDFRAKVGVSIPASNRGKVVLAMNLFYTGNTVIIDHGLGIFSVYGHLSRLLVEKDDLVNRQDIIGLAGNTGRVTGPHLHWGVKIHFNWVDGMKLISLK